MAILRLYLRSSEKCVPVDTLIAAAGKGEKILLVTFDVGAIRRFKTADHANEPLVGESEVQWP